MNRLLIALTLGLFACGSDSSGPAKIEAEGQWTGNIQHNDGTALGTMTLTLSETNSAVTGSGNINAGTEAIALTVVGTYTQPNLSVTLSSQGFSDVNLTATVGETSMTGTMNGSGFTGSSVTLHRQ